MEDAVRDLVTSPFTEIVDKGKTAADNAKEADNAAMLKAAQGVVNAGERALKKIEPLCKKHLEEFGNNFVVALKENGGSTCVSSMTSWRGWVWRC
jgi:hypothetical protein